MYRRALLSSLGAGFVAGCAGDEPGGRSTRTPTTQATETRTPTPTNTPTATEEPAETAIPPDGPQLGVSLSPRSFSGDDFTAFFEQASQAGSLVRWAGDWADLSNPDGAASVVATLAGQYDYQAVISTGVFSAGEKELFRPLDPDTQEEIVTTLSEFVSEHEPPYLEFGVEVDIHWENDPESFETFVELFGRVAEAVGTASPDTQVVVTFQLERLAGLQGGLFGGENDPDLAQWDLLDRFPGADLTGVTTYPGLVYGGPDEIPADHYSAVADRVDRPIAITETGWSATSVAPGWESDEATQAAFVERLFELTADVDLALALWAYVFAPAAAPAAFTGMGLRRPDGTARPAWDAWLARVAEGE